MKQYVYFFTRQDISPEQQLVQTAHVAASNATFFSESILDINRTYFIVLGVKNLEALKASMNILESFSFKYTYFVEPDLNNEITSIAVEPLYEDDPDIDIFKAFNLLKF